MWTRTLTRCYRVPGTVDQVWAGLVDRTALGAAASHAVIVTEMPPELAVGASWVEYHDDDCDFEVVRWVVTAVEAYRSFTIESRQAGALQRATTVLAAVPEGVQVTDVSRLSPSLRAPGGLVDRLLMLGLLATGWGMSIVAEQFDQAVRDERGYLEGLIC